MVLTRRPSTVTRAVTPKNLSVPVHSYDELSNVDMPAQNAALDDTVVMNDDFMNEPAVVNERAVESTHNVDDVIMHANVTDVDDRMRGDVDHFAMHDVTRISSPFSDRENKVLTPHPKGFSAVRPTDLPLSFPMSLR